MDLGLAGPAAAVTGSSQGLGRSTAPLFGSEGARVAVTYHRERDRALAVVAGIGNGGGAAVATQLDLASAGSASQAVGTALERWGQADVLVNNAVYWGDRVPWEAPLFEELAPEEWRARFRVNLEGALQCRPGGPAVHELPGVSAGSSASPRGWPQPGSPGPRHTGQPRRTLHGLTKTLSKELAPAGILVNVVMPSAAQTERMVARLPAQVLEASAQASPLRRLPRPEEVAAADLDPKVAAASHAAFRAGCHQDQRASRRVVPAACSGQDPTLAGHAIVFGFLAARCVAGSDHADLRHIRPAPPTVTEAGTARRH